MTLNDQHDHRLSEPHLRPDQRAGPGRLGTHSRSCRPAGAWRRLSADPYRRDNCRRSLPESKRRPLRWQSLAWLLSFSENSFQAWTWAPYRLSASVRSRREWEAPSTVYKGSSCVAEATLPITMVGRQAGAIVAGGANCTPPRLVFSQEGSCRVYDARQLRQALGSLFQ